MKVLLISPLRGLDPPCGDITYTEELISNMGHDVEYVTYYQAICDGTLVEITRRNWRKFPLLATINKVINYLRRFKLLYWEPIRFFEVKDGVYDVIHVHLFPFRMLNCSVPIVYSAGAPIRDLYRHTRRYSFYRENLLRTFERFLCSLLNYNHSLFNHPQISQMVVYTEYYKSRLDRESLKSPMLVSVLPISLPDKTPIRPESKDVVFGFIAFDFYAKGGAELISAFRKVLLEDPSSHLYVVGNIPSEFVLEPQVTFLGPKDRSFILDELLPSIDVFVYPTHQDCFSYVMLEAMRAGCAICTSDYVSMPEAVDYGNAGLISPVGDVESLASNMIEMLNVDTRRKYQIAARLQFLKKFDSAIVLSKLYEIYSDLTSQTKKSNRKTE